MTKAVTVTVLRLLIRYCRHFTGMPKKRTQTIRLNNPLIQPINSICRVNNPGHANFRIWKTKVVELKLLA